MKGSIGYKQYKEHFNSAPDIKMEIAELSTLGNCRYNPNDKKTADISEFLKRPVRYHFDIKVKPANVPTLFHHACYFDSKEDAEKAHRQFKIKLYDQQTKPYLDKIAKKRNLSVEDQEKILQIIDMIDKI